MYKNPRLPSMAALCLAYGAAALSGTAAAADLAAPHEVVRYADLNLSDPGDARVLYRRIQAAATRVCQSSSVLDRNFRDARHVCYRHAIDEAVKHVDSAALSQIHGVAAQHLASR